MRRAAILLLIVAVLSACTSVEVHDHGAHDHTHAVHNDADIAFARNMIPHHQQAVALAAMVPTNTANPDLRVIASHIGAAQHAEIGVMQDLLESWGEPEDPHASHHGEMHTMTGMVDDATMQRLPTLYDDAFDTLWTTSMIGHHEGAVTMAEEELANGASPDAKQLARVIVETQQREISRMRHLVSATQ